MLNTGKALKVSIYVDEGATHHGFSSVSGIVDFLFYRGVSGAIVVKGIAGFGADHRIHAASTVEISDRLPVKIEFVESPAKVEELMSKLQELAGPGMIEVHETTVMKAPDDRADLRPLVHQRSQTKGRMLRIYVNHKDKWEGKPLHEALVEALRANEMDGVTVYQSILAYGSGGDVHKQKVFGDGTSLMVTTVDTEDRIAAFLPLLDKMMPDGLVVISDVDVVQYRNVPGPGRIHDGAKTGG